MSGAFAAGLSVVHRSFATPPARGEDRWLLGVHATRTRRFTAATAAVLALSVLMHGAFLATALLGDRSPRDQPSEEIAVEVVHEVPKPPEPAKTAEAQLPELATPPALALKQSLPPVEEQKPPPPPPEPQKLAAPEEQKPPPPKALQPPEPAKPPAPEAAKPPRQAEEAAELKSLQAELDKLKAEHADVEAEAPEDRPPTQSPALAALGLGPLAGSLQAVALPGATMETGETVGYEAIVFSQLAKAKAIGGQMGTPGSAGVRFDIDDKGALLDVELVKSSGVTILDDEALSIVRKAAPFPPPPQGAQRHFSANVSFVAGSNR